MHLKPLTNPDAPHDAGRNTPAARAYTNARRAGRTHPGKIELRNNDNPVGNPFTSIAELVSNRFAQWLKR